MLAEFFISILQEKTYGEIFAWAILFTQIGAVIRLLIDDK